MEGNVKLFKGRAKREFFFFKKAEAIPPRVEEPKLVPTAEANGFPNPAPKGAWVPKAQRESICFTPLNVFCVPSLL